MNRLDLEYLWLLRKIKEDGVQKEGRNGSTRSIFGYQLRHDMRDGFPLLTSKKMWFKGIRTELEWFLNGNTNIQHLVQQGNNIWAGDAYKRYINSIDSDRELPCSEERFIEKIKTDDEFAKKWGDMGPIYGAQWRKWTSKYWVPSAYVDAEDKHILNGTESLNGGGTRKIIVKDIHVDQIQNLIDDLIEKPDSRRMMVSAWNVGQLDDMVLPPCHYGFQVWTRELTDEEKEFYNTDYDRGISLMWNQRSVDTPLGLPFNIASYGLLLEMIADEVNMLPLELIGNLGDTHIYENQLEGVEEQLKREDDIHELPTVHVRDGIWSRGSGDIILKNYKSEGKINFPLSN